MFHAAFYIDLFLLTFCLFASCHRGLKKPENLDSSLKKRFIIIKTVVAARVSVKKTMLKLSFFCCLFISDQHRSAANQSVAFTRRTLSVCRLWFVFSRLWSAVSVWGPSFFKTRSRLQMEDLGSARRHWSRAERAWTPY